MIKNSFFIFTSLFLSIFSAYPMQESNSVEGFLGMFLAMQTERHQKAALVRQVPEVQRVLEMLQNPQLSAADVLKELDTLSREQLKDTCPFRDIFHEQNISQSFIDGYFALIDQKKSEMNTSLEGYQNLDQLPENIKDGAIELCHREIKRLSLLKEIFKPYPRFTAFMSNIPDFHPDGMAKTDSGCLVPMTQSTHIGQQTPYGTIVAIKPKKD